MIATAGPTLTAELAGFGARVTAYGKGLAERVRALAGGNVDDLGGESGVDLTPAPTLLQTDASLAARSEFRLPIARLAARPVA